ncbi:Protein of unknown function [Modicisalibacter muralis]|uniref:DUF4242 domain-containing protein n=1 Tax=Modicisalibacter muralis TaxID=119000 RepID=A0A1G9GSG2_9GAMM|nr:nickel-binding protein [Halomonas muralis]SDL03554.1 Protein of unknown function [Halomonas muralis]
MPPVSLAGGPDSGLAGRRLDMTKLIVERYFDTPLTDSDFEQMGSRLLPCIAQYGGKWLQSYVSADRKHTVCAFDAPDAESIRMAHRTAEVRLDKVWSADIITPEDIGPSPHAA